MSPIRFREKKICLPEKLDYDCRLQIKNNKWYLLVPLKVNNIIYEQKYNYCGLDPGVRTFYTGYSEDIVFQVKHNKDLIVQLTINFLIK